MKYKRQRPIFKAVVYLLVGAVFPFLLASCSSKAKWIDSYEKNLPPDESINATVYNYELFANRIKKAYDSGDYEKSLQIINDYFDIFSEGSHNDTDGDIGYYMYSSLSQLVEKGTFQEYAGKLKKNDRRSLRIMEKAGNKKGAVTYAFDDGALRELMSGRVKYPIELKIVEEFYIPTLFSDKKSIKEKVEMFEALSKRYPNTDKWLPFFETDQYKRYKGSVKKEQRETLERLEQGVKDNQFSKEGVKYRAYVRPDSHALIKDKKELLFFRNIYRFDGWEGVDVYGESQVMDSEGKETQWVEVAFGPYRGFTEKRNLYVDVKADKRDDGQFFDLQNRYITKDYIGAAKLAAKLIRKWRNSDFLKEREFAIFYLSNSEIKNRATSINNDFYRYVKRYPNYFYLTKDETTLRNSPLLFNNFANRYPSSQLRYILLRDE